MDASPGLRFDEYVTPWSRDSIGNVATLQRGFDLPKHSRIKGSVPIVSSGGITGRHNVSKVAPPGIVTGRYGSIGELYFLDEPFWPLNTSLWVKNFHGNDELFCFYLLSRVDLKSLSDKTGVPGINRNDVHKIPTAVPSVAEQKKIAEFLGAMDEKIRLLQSRHEQITLYKKGIMQKIFTQTLRFKADDGNDFPDWEFKKLGEVFERVTRKNVEDDQNVLTISGQLGLINQREYFNKSVSSKDVTGYYLIKNGEFAYNKSYSKGYPMGAIKRLNRYEQGVVSTLYICFQTPAEISAKFYEQFFEGGGLIHELSKIAQEGARNHGLLNISVVEFFKDIKIPFPSTSEQQKIADFLSAIDEKIEAVSAQIENMQSFKKGLLQQMFV